MKYKSRGNVRPVKVNLEGDTKSTALALIANMVISPEQEAAGNEVF